ncbi:MAG: HAMP domain-containing histidine kinase [Lachnospiraceae bacterium]|nr:HAMP domain-containing histidine kinase [Lachnospiraceae bacterium]
MKNYFRLLTVIALILLIAVVSFIIITNKTDTGSYGVSNENIVTLNRIADYAEKHRNDLNSFDDAGFDVNFAIVDDDNNLLYSHFDAAVNSGDETDTDIISIEKAIKRRYPYRYLTDNNRLWGAAILLDEGTERYRSLVKSLTAAIIIFCLTVLIIAACYGIYVHKNIIAPFNNLKDFAVRIAQGNLDDPLEMNRNNMFGAFTQSFDIMREELNESRKRELALQKKEKELVASLSHDLKTPVTGIKVTAELMQMRLSVKADSIKDGENKNSGQSGTAETGEAKISADELRLLNEDAAGILNKAEQIDTLLSDLFTSTLDDLGEIRVNCQDEESRILGDIVESFDDRGLAVSEEIPAVIIHTDKKRMSQVIGNIFSNSYKYANTRIHISYRISDHYLEMRIEDHGPGVPAGEIDLITNKFYRGKDWVNTDKDGHGLGLYISKTLMNMMNGDLIAESDGGGLAITLVIPLS